MIAASSSPRRRSSAVMRMFSRCRNACSAAPCTARAQLADVPGLDQHAVDADLVDCVERRLEVGEAAHQQSAHLGTHPPALGEELDPAHARHAQVGDDDVELLGVQERERLLRRGRGGDHHVGVLAEQPAKARQRLGSSSTYRTRASALPACMATSSSGGSAGLSASSGRESRNARAASRRRKESVSGLTTEFATVGPRPGPSLRRCDDAPVTSALDRAVFSIDDYRAPRSARAASRWSMGVRRALARNRSPRINGGSGYRY